MAEYTLHQTIMHSGGITGVMAKRIEEAVIAWLADDENSMAYKCLELIKANAEVAELWVKQQERITDLEDALVKCAAIAQNWVDGDQIVEVVQSMAREDDNAADGKQAVDDGR